MACCTPRTGGFGIFLVSGQGSIKGESYPNVGAMLLALCMCAVLRSWVSSPACNDHITLNILYPHS